MTQSRKRLIIIGAGSLGVMTLDAALEMDRYDTISFIDDGKEINSLIHNYKVLGGLNVLQEISVKEFDFVIAIANNKVRKKVADEHQLNYVNIIHPQVSISRFAKIGKGNIIMPNTSIDPETVIDNHVIINKNSSLGHNVEMKNYTQASPGCSLGGTIGEGTFIGLGGVVLPEIKIGEFSTIGAGAVVTKNIPGHVTAVGIPAKIIKE